MKNVLPLVKRMMEMGAVEITELIEEKYKPKTEVYVRLADFYHKESELNTLLDALSKHPKREMMLMTYLQLSQFLRHGGEKGAVETL